MWLLTCNAIVELPHNALCIYNAPLREFADLIGTLLRITSCMVFFSPPLHAVARLHPSAGAKKEPVGFAGIGRPPLHVLLHLLNVF